MVGSDLPVTSPTLSDQGNYERVPLIGYPTQMLLLQKFCDSEAAAAISGRRLIPSGFPTRLPAWVRGVHAIHQ